MMLLLCLFLLMGISGGSSSLAAEQLFRVSADDDLEARGLYRIRDEKAMSELQLLRRDDGEWTPAVMILDTPCYKAGSLTPSGLWRFCGMKDLLSEEELNRDTGLRPDRSDTSLERPAVSIKDPAGRGGVLFKQEESLRQSALWGRVCPDPYFELELGESLLLPDPVEEDDCWFPGEREDRPVGAVSLTAGDLRWERPDAAFRMRSAAVLSRFRKPAYSLLPGWRFFFEAGELQSRLWYTSGSWLGEDLEPVLWSCLWDNLLILHLPRQLRLKGNAAGGVAKTGYPGGACGFSVELHPGPAELKVRFDLKTDSEEEAVDHEYGGSVCFYQRIWREKLKGEMSFRDDRPSGWSVEPELRWSPRSGRYDKLSCTAAAEPGRFTLTPCAESSVPLGRFRIGMTVSYELLYSEDPVPRDEDDPLSFRLTGELTY